jgi:hypothetical protein
MIPQKVGHFAQRRGPVIVIRMYLRVTVATKNNLSRRPRTVVVCYVVFLILMTISTASAKVPSGTRGSCSIGTSAASTSVSVPSSAL